MKTVLLEPLGISNERLQELASGLSANGDSFISYSDVERDTGALIKRIDDADALIIANNPLPNEAIADAKNLKYISVAFVGVDHVGKDACLSREIPVSNAAGYCTDAVAELALALCLDCLRNVSICNAVVRDGGVKDGLVGHELRGKTVGIVGTGEIGCRTAELFKALGCKIIGYSRSRRAAAESLGLEYMSLDELLPQSDIVSIHTPLTDETRNLIDREKLALMKPSAVLINTARGAVTDNNAVAAALKAGKLAAAGIDVFETEPPIDREHPLFNAPNLVATPHIAFATKESIDRRASIVFDNVYRWREGEIQNRML